MSADLIPNRESVQAAEYRAVKFFQYQGGLIDRFLTHGRRPNEALTLAYIMSVPPRGFGDQPPYRILACWGMGGTETLYICHLCNREKGYRDLLEEALEARVPRLLTVPMLVPWLAPASLVAIPVESFRPRLEANEVVRWGFKTAPEPYSSRHFSSWFREEDPASFVEESGLAFDLDETLAPKRAALSKDKRLQDLVGLLSRGVRVAVVSGNSWADVEQRVVVPLAASMADDTAPLRLLTVYADACTVKYRLDDTGQMSPERTYGQEFEFKSVEVLAVLEELQRFGNERFGLSSDQIQWWQDYYEQQCGERIKNYSLTWAEGQPYHPQCIDAAIALNRDGRLQESPWLERRGRTFTIKMLPCLGGRAEVRHRLIRRLKACPALARIARVFDIRPGGTGSVDFAAAKCYAVHDFIRSNGLAPQHTYYFGDEFSFQELGDDTIPGNDLSVFCPDLAQLRVIAVNKMTHPPEDRVLSFGAYSATWIGSGPQAVASAIGDVANFIEKRA